MSRPADQGSSPDHDRRLRARRAIGEQLRSTRRRAGLSQSELSALSGLGINTITRCERGSIAVTLDTLDRLAEVLHCDFIVAAWPRLPDRTKASDRPAASDRSYTLPEDAPAGAGITDDATTGDATAGDATASNTTTGDTAAGDAAGYDLDDA